MADHDGGPAESGSSIRVHHLALGYALFPMIGDPNTTAVCGLFAYPGKESFALFEGSLMVIAPDYPVFGEVPTVYASAPNARGFSDTGLTQRGLLPMSKWPEANLGARVRRHGYGHALSGGVHATHHHQMLHSTWKKATLASSTGFWTTAKACSRRVQRQDRCALLLRIANKWPSPA